MPVLSEADEHPSSPENQQLVHLRLSAFLILHCRQILNISRMSVCVFHCLELQEPGAGVDGAVPG